jgi:hypothetical protein
MISAFEYGQHANDASELCLLRIPVLWQQTDLNSTVLLDRGSVIGRRQTRRERPASCFRANGRQILTQSNEVPGPRHPAARPSSRGRRPFPSEGGSRSRAWSRLLPFPPPQRSRAFFCQLHSNSPRDGTTIRRSSGRWCCIGCSGSRCLGLTSASTRAARLR